MGWDEEMEEGEEMKNKDKEAEEEGGLRRNQTSTSQLPFPQQYPVHFHFDT